MQIAIEAPLLSKRARRITWNYQYLQVEREREKICKSI